MANTLKTLTNGKVLRIALAIFHNKLKFIKTVDRQYDSRINQSGAKSAGQILIRDPNQFTVRTGATMNTNDITETTQTLTVATQKGVDLPSFTSLEETMYVDDYVKRYIEPAMSRLAADVEFSILADRYKDIFNLSGTPATTMNTKLAALKANVKLSQNLAPMENRYLLMDADNMANTVNSFATYFQKSDEISRAFSEGYVGRAAGMDFMESEMLPTHTNGTRTDTTPVTDTSAGTFINGATTLVTTGQGNTETSKAGDIFTIDDVFAVNLETKGRLAHLQQFVIRTDITNDTTDTWDIAPTIYKSGAKQNVDVANAGSQAIVHVAAGGSGAVSLVKVQNLAYQKFAFAVAFGHLHMERNENMEQKTIEGIPMRFWRSADIINDKFPARIDVLFGSKTLRPEWAVRARG